MKMNKTNQARQAKQARIAATLWERLVDTFNEEAKTYDAEHPDSPLGSVGEVYCREVCRPNWWKALGVRHSLEVEVRIEVSSL